MHSLSQLFGDALRITRKGTVLWLYQAIPMVLTCIVGWMVAQRSIIPLVQKYVSFAEANSFDYEFLASVPTMVLDVFYTLIPLLLVSAALALVFRNAMYASIARMAHGERLSFSQGLLRGLRFVWITLGVLAVLFIAQLLLTGLTVLFVSFEFNSVVGFLIKTALSLIVALAGLFAWPAVVVGGKSIGNAFISSVRLTLRHMWPISIVLGCIFLLQIVIACLIGAAVGIGHFIDISAGVVSGAVILLLFVPVRVYMHALYVLLYMSMSANSSR